VAQQHDGQGVKVRIVNIVAVTALQSPFSLAKLKAVYPFAGENCLTHIAVSHERSYFAIFSTGKVLSFSSKSILGLEDAFTWLRAFLAQFGLKLSNSYEIVNVVGVLQTTTPLDLLVLGRVLPHSAYEPPSDLGLYDYHRQINALIYHFAPSPIRSRQTALIFSTGRVVLTGFKSIEILKMKAHLLADQIAQIVTSHPSVLAEERVPLARRSPNIRSHPMGAES